MNNTVIKRLIKHRYKLCLAFSIIFGIIFRQSLPDPLFDEPFSSVLLSRRGKLLGAKIAQDEQWRFPTMKHLPHKYKIALIHFEDKRFNSHFGVDPIAILRSTYLNLSQAKIVSGASTITMQVIRLSRKNSKRTFIEKAIEMILAFRLELSHSKEEILALYAGHAPFGGNVVGLETASWRYFARHPKDLSWAETATLVVLPNSPSLIHPGRNRIKLKKKRDRLLIKLNEKGVINDLDLKISMLENLPAKPIPLPRIAPYLLETLIAKHRSSKNIFHSTIDASLQMEAENIVHRHSNVLTRRGIYNSAVIVVDNQSFEVLAYVGNSNITLNKEKGYAIDIIQKPRSTGSILKPFLFSALIKAGEIHPKSLLPDVPTQYSGYKPENFDRKYRGAVQAQKALIRSLNVPSVYMLKNYGLHRFYDFLKQMGMTTLHRTPDEYGLTLILGGAEGTLWDLSGMYANLAYIAKLNFMKTDSTYKKLKVLKSEDINSHRVMDIDPPTAWLTINALSEVNRPKNEGHWKNFSSQQKIAWKTGTSHGLKDGWAIGSTTRYTVGVWVGNASGEGKADLTGLSSAAPLLFDIFNILDKSKWFEMPYHLMKKIELCKDNGYLVNNGCEKEIEWLPRNSHFEEASSHHRLIHLDKTGTYRVHSGCESPENMIHKSWFVLPPKQEYFYKRVNSGYRVLPPFRKDCINNKSIGSQRGPIDFLYPTNNTKVYIPVDLDEVKSRIVCKAVHRNPDAELYWHLDNRYIGKTKTFHHQALNVIAGKHRITVVDVKGNRLSRTFTVLEKEKNK